MQKYLERDLGPTIHRALRTFPAVVVTGARQTGKTTLLREEFGSSFGYLSLEDPDVRSAALSDPRSFLRHHPPPCILDEIQHTPPLLSYLKTAIDQDRHPGQWILTGSQSFPLMESVSQSLAGLAAILHLQGLSARELEKRERIATADEMLIGFFPEPRLDRDVDLRLWMASYVQTYLERDVRSLVQVADLVAFEQFLRLCAARTSQLLSYAELARDAGIAPNTAKRWLAVLEASGLFMRLPPYSRSLTKRMVKSPKLYPADPGLAAFLTGHRHRDLVWSGPMKGALFEATVLSEIVKAFRNAGDVPPIHFWRSSDGLEVDFVIEMAGRLHGVECKANATPAPRMGEALTRWRRLVGSECGTTVLACDVEERQPLLPGIEALPWRQIGAFCQELLGTGA